MQLRHLINSKLIFLCLAAIPTGKAETFQGVVGLDQTKIVSTAYKANSFSAPCVELTYSRPLFGRFSMIGQYHMNSRNSYSSGLVGFMFDSEDIIEKGGTLSPDGSAEITRIPLWLFRAEVGLGLFRYVDTLEKNDASLGNRNRVPVQADLYGLKFGGSAHRFLGERWGVSGGLAYSVASASGFGLSNTQFTVGAIYRN